MTTDTFGLLILGVLVLGIMGSASALVILCCRAFEQWRLERRLYRITHEHVYQGKPWW